MAVLYSPILYYAYFGGQCVMANTQILLLPQWLRIQNITPPNLGKKRSQIFLPSWIFGLLPCAQASDRGLKCQTTSDTPTLSLAERERVCVCVCVCVCVYVCKSTFRSVQASLVPVQLTTKILCVPPAAASTILISERLSIRVGFNFEDPLLSPTPRRPHSPRPNA